MDQRRDKVPAAHIVSQIAKSARRERNVTHVLRQASAVRIGVGLLELLLGGVRKSLQQKGTDVRLPSGIDDRLMSQNRVGMPKPGRQEQDPRAKSASKHYPALQCAIIIPMQMPLVEITPPRST